jgi:hypothetical protein
MARQPVMAPVFAPLLDHLIACPADTVILSFDEIEALIGVPLPVAYRVEWNCWAHRQYVHVRLWRALGWRAHFDRRQRRVVFRRLAAER